MQLDATKTVREFAIEIPNATRVFEKLKIDYCCGGNQQLNEACGQKGLNVEDVLQSLTEARNEKIDSQSQPYQGSTLANLINVIVDKHHVFTREELVRLTGLFDKVCAAHGPNHPELLEIRTQFQALRADLEPHMMKEEQILFPYIKRLETAATTNQPAPFAPFGDVRNPITVMLREHDAAGDILRVMRELSHDFVTPPDACLSYRTLYGALAELEADLHQHIHLENNVLFPQSLEMQQKVLTRNI